MLKQVIFQGQTQAGIFCQPIFGNSGAFEKVAGAPPFADWETGDDLRKYIGKITRADRAKSAYVLVNALGAGEYYGSNINADYFGWTPLTHQGKDYGYQTFLDANAFQHHKNKDARRAFGKPELSLVNGLMKRIELVVRLDREKAKFEQADGIITRIDAGEFPDVSMGCFLSGTLVTMADGTRKPIELIQVGDEVVTHTGRVAKVTETHRRQYKGSIYTLKAEGHRPIRSTRQHPWGTFTEDEVKVKDSHSNLRWRPELAGDLAWTESECLDDAPHYLAEPVLGFDPSVTPFVVQPTRAQARLLGYYLAEGHLLRSKSGELSGIELTTNREDSIHEEIESLCEAFGTKNAPVTFDRVNSEQSLGIWVFDAKLAEYCSRFAGQYSKEKKLAKDVLYWNEKSLRELLGAYGNGDGCGSEDGSLGLSTSSEGLAQQWLMILPRIGIIPSLSVLNHKAGTSVDGIDTIEFVVHIGKQWAQKLRDVCAKVKRVEIEKTKLSRNLMSGYIVTPIRYLDSMYVETEVFNFEVEGDNSYLVEGLAVHNCKVPYDVCSICGEKSKTRDDYCEHMSPPEELRFLFGPNKILVDGRKIYVLNLHPRFFDISFVFIGADKTAKVMAKLASHGRELCMGDVCTLSAESPLLYGPDGTPLGTIQEMAKHYAGRLRQAAYEVRAEEAEKTASACECGCAGDCSDMDKIAHAFAVPKTAHKKLSEIIKEIPAAVSALSKSEPDLASADLNELAESKTLPDILGGVTGAGMLLKPHEFQRIVLVRMGEPELADDLDSKSQVFQQSKIFEDVRVGEEMARLVMAILPAIEKYIRARTAFGVPFQERLLEHRDEKALPIRKPIAHPLLDKISHAYNGYRREVVLKLSEARDAVRSDPQLREAVLGDGLVDMFSKTSSTTPVVSLDSMAYLMGAHLDRGLLTNTAVADAIAANNPWLLEEPR